jgi:thiol-disulfide isomerase/thioredoxin
MASPSLFRRRGSLFVTLAAIGLATFLGLKFLPVSAPSTAPEVPLALLSGETQSLSQYRSRVVLVNFWAPSCPPCVEELPDLIALHEQYAARGLVLLGVVLSYEPPLAVQQFIAQRPLPYPVVLDVQNRVAQGFGGAAVAPTSVLIDKQGTILWRRAGKLDIARAKQDIERILKETAE